MTLLTSSGVFLVLGKKTDKEKLGYYEIENIDNPCLVSLAVNPKEYLELLKDMLFNKKMGKLRKDLLEWDLKILPKELNLW